jgi:mycobactin phenyloxazoline synthetase
VPTTGGSDVLAAVVHVDDERLTAGEIREDMRNFVPAHMVPRHVSLVERIPYTIGGKIDRRAVADQLAASVASSAQEVRRAASTPVEAALAAIIGEVLGVEHVGVDDDFFALGGDSVSATAAVTRIRTWLDVPGAMVADMFAGRTPSGQAGLLSRREGGRGRLDSVAEIYLEVARMDAQEVLAESADPGMAHGRR